MFNRINELKVNKGINLFVSGIVLQFLIRVMNHFTIFAAIAAIIGGTFLGVIAAELNTSPQPSTTSLIVKLVNGLSTDE